jgi:hypothetical protein
VSSDLVTPKVGAKHELLFNKPASVSFIFNGGGWFVEQRLVLSSSFRCDQINNCKRHHFGHTVVLLKFDLDIQQTHFSFLNKRFDWVRLAQLELSSSFRCNQIHNCHRYDFDHTLYSDLSWTEMFNKPTSVCCTKARAYLQL